MNERMLSEKELAEILGLSPWTVRTMRLREGLPFLRGGSRIFYRLEKVKSWMENQEDKNSKEHTVSRVKVPKYSW
ncbi:MAG: Helix-turn-helix domain [Firmicutes bacterium]|nr:Helix-turn-helix domain [Bacillota bacterium]